MFTVVMLLIFTLVRNLQTVMLLMLPVTLIFSILGILTTDMTILLIIVAVLGLASTARNVWRRSYERSRQC